MKNMTTYLNNFFAIALLFMLLGCAQQQEVKDNLDRNTAVAQDALTQIEPSKNAKGSLVVDSRPWYGAKAIPISKGDPLPNKFIRNDSIVITFPEPLSLAQLRSEIQKVTGIRVVYDRSRTGGDTRFLPSDGLQVTGGRVVWQGSLEDLLNQVADGFNIGWEFRNGIV